MSILAINGGNKIRERGWRGWPRFDDAVVDMVSESVRSGSWCRGQAVKDFESLFADYIGTKYCLAVNGGGTIALYIALQAAGIRRGDEVIIPPYTFIGTATGIFMLGAEPIFADIDVDSYCLSPESFEKHITNKTKAVIPVHVCGCPADMEAIVDIANKHGIIVIEDDAHAHGTIYRNKHAGNLGHIGCFSCQQSKNLTCGDGGLITTNDEEWYKRMYAVHTVNRTLDGRDDAYDDIIGNNFRMTSMQAALLSGQFDSFKMQSELRDRNSRYLYEELSKYGLEKVNRTADTTRHGSHIFACRYNSGQFKGLAKGRFIEAINAEGIPFTSGYGMLNKSKALSSRWIGYSYCVLPDAEKASNESLWLSQYILLGDKNDMVDIAHAVEKVQYYVDELL